MSVYGDKAGTALLRWLVRSGGGFGFGVTGGTPVPLCLLRWLPLGRALALRSQAGRPCHFAC